MKSFLKNNLLTISILTLLTGLCLSFYRWNYSFEKPLPKNTVVDKIVVLKSKRELQLWYKNTLLKTYKISLGLQPIGHKEYEGDRKTPEGSYFINGKNPTSDYYKNLGISYPNNKDRAYAKSMGKSTGGDVKIHGMRNDMTWWGNAHRFRDWTHGCIAVTNPEMEEIYSVVKMKTVIEIKE